MDKEVRFAQILEEVKRSGRSQGNHLTENQVRDAFSELELSEDRLKMVFDYLTKQHISVGDMEGEEEEISEEEMDFLQMYLDDLDGIKIYSDGEKKAYTIQAMAGDESAQQKIVEMYLKNVVDIAHLYTGQGVMIEDLIGEGNVALSTGVTMLGSQEKPEDCEGMLIKMVMDAMEELVKEDSDSDQVGQKALGRVNDVFEKAEKLSKDYGGKITVEDLCDEAHLTRKAVIDAMRISGNNIDCIVTPPELGGNDGDSLWK